MAGDDDDDDDDDDWWLAVGIFVYLFEKITMQ
jgi:hypothetical protein